MNLLLCCLIIGLKVTVLATVGCLIIYCTNLLFEDEENIDE